MFLYGMLKMKGISRLSYAYEKGSLKLWSCLTSVMEGTQVSKTAADCTPFIQHGFHF
jgi:hypothetical protein